MSAVLLDVRTPAEFAEGHLDGAVLLDVTAADGPARIRGLAPDAAYVVYCRSGNRSAHAAAMMRAVGIVDVLDAGSLHDAARRTGRAVVTGA